MSSIEEVFGKAPSALIPMLCPFVEGNNEAESTRRTKYLMARFEGGTWAWEMTVGRCTEGL
ncbi:MAG TPA: hypothetical protein VGE21_04830, partial [Flavobacteriales bacterium]